MFKKSGNVLYHHDMILSFIYDKLFAKYGCLKASLVLFLIPIVLCFATGLIENTFESRPGLIGVKLDYALYVILGVVILSLVLFYRFSIFAREFLTNDIAEVVEVEKIKDELPEIDRKLARILQPSGVFSVCRWAIIAIFISFWFLNVLKAFDPVANYHSDIWHSWHYKIGFVVGKLVNLVYYTILLSLFFYRFIANLIGFSWLFRKISKKEAFIVRPMFPDKCAGLNILSQLSIRFMYMVLPFFLIYLSILLRGTNFLIGQQLSLLGLTVLLFVTFFLPLGSVHSAMKRAKHIELTSIAEHFRRLNRKVKHDLDDREYGQNLISDVESLEKLNFMYSKVNSMPVWPFNVKNIGRLISATLVPIMIFVLQHYLVRYLDN